MFPADRNVEESHPDFGVTMPELGQKLPIAVFPPIIKLHSGIIFQLRD